MIKKIKKYKKRFFDIDKLSMRLVLFNYVTFGGIIGATLGLVFSAFLGVSIIQIFAIAVALLVLFSSFYLANWKNRVDYAATSTIFAGTLILFPVMFFSGGGIESGMGYWFVMGILFNLMLVRNTIFYVLLALQIITIIACYVGAYFFPDLVIPMESSAAYMIDMLQSLFMLAFVVGLIIKFQSNVYEQVLEKINRKNEQLKASEERADRANQAKSEFLSNMSHEIRTPINAIIGMNQVIMRESSEEKIVGYASTVENSANWLLSIITDILDISKIEEGRIEIVPVEYDICSLMIDCYNMIKKRARDKNLEINVSLSETFPRVVIGDVMRVRQVIVNLLTNSIKYTEKGSVDLFVNDLKINNIFFMEIIVRDTGIGIKESDMERLFEKFQRFDIERNRNVEGTGLGLNITRRLVELMGGNIEVKSEYQKGTTFNIVIPHRRVGEKPVGHFEITESVAEEKKRKYRKKFIAPEANILVVDDVKINIYVLENLLKETRINIDRALNGAECIRLMRKKCYDIVFMDHMMPEMDGIETYRKIKAMPDSLNGDTPFIMLTANALSGMEKIYKENGFMDYLTKPINYEALETVIMRYLPKFKIIEPEEEIPEKQPEPAPEPEMKRVIELHDIIPEADIQSGVAYCDGSEDFYIELLKDYSSTDRIEELEKFYVAKDWANYKISVHSLKSLSKTLGFNKIGKMAEKLQNASENLDIQYVEENHRVFTDCVNELLTRLQNFL